MYDYINKKPIGVSMKKYIYESPDKGKTVYRREFGKLERELVDGDRVRSGSEAVEVQRVRSESVER
jgi:hypothetical protein